MILRRTIAILLILGITGCKTKKVTETYSDIRVAGVMKNVMWKGDLSDKINLDTISKKKGLYGLGPGSHLVGELLINDGRSYFSRVDSNATMTVNETFDVSAPFFVYAHVSKWEEILLPSHIKTIKDLEDFIDQRTVELKRPLAFKLQGTVAHAKIHVQNLPIGSKVSSPAEAHIGQMQYHISNKEAEIIGFFSTAHKGVFTHHDTFLHMHLITKDQNSMGHLDELEIGNMKLYLPKK